MPSWMLRTDPVAGAVAIFQRKTPDITSVSSHSFTTGSKTFVVAAGLSISAGDRLAIEYVLYPSNFMIGTVTSYSGTSLVINVTRAVGSGTFANWRMVDVTPLYNPNSLDSMQRLTWTSAFASISTTPALTQQVGITIPALTRGQVYSNTFQLFSHGLGAACAVEGRVMNLGGAGIHVPIVGSLPVWMQTVSGQNNGFGTLLELGATSTHVVAIVSAMLSHNASATAAAAQSLTIEASAFNFTTAAALPEGSPALPIMKYVPNSHLTLGRGQLDTRRRYPRRVTSGHDNIIAKSETLAIVGSGKAASPSYAQNEVGWRWRYACDGYVAQTERGWNGAATNGGSATTDATRTKK